MVSAIVATSRQIGSQLPVRSSAWWWVALSAAAASLCWPALALPAAFACLLAALTEPRSAPRQSARRWGLLAAACASAFGLVRFVVFEAVPGIVGGGQRAVEQRTISRLRDVLFAQDALRRSAWIDPDGDGVGSAAFLSELCGLRPRRGQPERAIPALQCEELVDTPIGPAALAGAYRYTVCLPTPDGGWSAHPESAVDEEGAERAFTAYAWPAPDAPFARVFFIDEHENILERELSAPSAAAQARSAPPITCDAALGAGRKAWRPWRGKRPRTELPGEGKAGAWE